MPKKKSKHGKPEVHKDLEGFEIHINEFGEIIPNAPIEKINEFLNKKVADKKLVDREDYEDIRGEEELEEEVELDDEVIRRVENMTEDDLPQPSDEDDV